MGRARGGRARTTASVADAVTEMTMMFASRSTPGSLERDRLLGRASRSVVRRAVAFVAIPIVVGDVSFLSQSNVFQATFFGLLWQTISRVDFLPECRFFKGKSARIMNRKLRGRLHGVLVSKGSFWRGR